MMQAVLDSVTIELGRSVSTAITLWAIPRPVCPPCAPELHCGEVRSCPDCVCSGSHRECPEADCPACDRVSYCVGGILVGIIAALLSCLVLSHRRRQAPRLSPLAPKLEDWSDDDLALTAKAQAELLRLKRNALTR